MEALDAALAALERLPAAQALRFSRWTYAAVNTAHVLGVAMLVGAALPLALRLLGLWPGIARADVARLLAPVAAAGLGLAVLSGLALFATRASEYGDLRLLQVKLGLVALGAAAALLAHGRHRPWLGGAGRGQAAVHGLLSIACWLGALVCGRLIAFVGD